MKPSTGFTLVEMMIAVAIIAILLGTAAPAFQTFIRNTKIRTTAESMQAGLSLARMEALRRNARVSFWLVNNVSASCARSASGTSWVVSFDNPAGACNATASNTTAPRLIQTRSGADGSAGVSVSAREGLVAAAPASSCITFNGFGSVESGCAGGGAPIRRIEVNAANAPAGTRALDVRVTSGGAIRMCDPSVTNSADPYVC